MSGGFAEMLRDIQRRGSARLGAKLPSWAGLDIEVPSSLNFQQCSGESAARYKASLVPSGSRVADLTGGLGVDSWAFAQRASAVWYNERDVALKAAVERNFGVLGLSNVSFNNFDISPESRGWQDALKEFAPDLIYLDPARRDAAGRKVFLLEECSPDVLALMPVLLNLAPTVMVKVSPMADITMLRRRLEGMLSELHVVGADGECKELLCICGGASYSGPMPEEAQARIVLAEDGIVYSGSCGKCSPGIAPAPLSPKFYGAPEQYPGCTEEEALLFVPSAAMVKSGLGPGLCLMEYDKELSHFGKFWQVIENLPFASSAIKSVGRRYPQAEVTARGVQLSSEQLRAKIKTKPGGSVHIFACVLYGQRRLLICKQMPCPEQMV